MSHRERAVESLTAASRPLRPVAVVLMALGAVAFVIGVTKYLGAPAELTMGEPGWFESVKAHNDATFTASAFMMFGGFFVLAGAGALFSSMRAVNRMRVDTLSGLSAAVRDGFGSPVSGGDPAGRLAKIDDLHRAGHITAAERERKRAEILAEL